MTPRMFWALNLSDGQHSLFDAAERSQLPFPTVHATSRVLETTGLLGGPDGPAGASP
jgi:aminopeptidase-like protein